MPLGGVLGPFGSVLGPLGSVLGLGEVILEVLEGSESGFCDPAALFEGPRPETLYFTRVWEGPRGKVHPRMARKWWFVGRGGRLLEGGRADGY